MSKGKYEVAIKDKVTLSFEEAAAYSGIGINRIRSMVKEYDSILAFHIGNKTLIKRKSFENFIERNQSF